jgi:hypothetical protein
MIYRCKWRKIIVCGWDEHSYWHDSSLNRKGKRRRKLRIFLKEPKPYNEVKLAKRSVRLRFTLCGSIVTLEGEQSGQTLLRVSDYLRSTQQQMGWYSRLISRIYLGYGIFESRRKV